MRTRLLLTVVAPVFFWAATVWLRSLVNIQAWQWQWVLYVLFMSIGGFSAGFGFRAYWWPCDGPGPLTRWLRRRIEASFTPPQYPPQP